MGGRIEHKGAVLCFPQAWGLGSSESAFLGFAPVFPLVQDARMKALQLLMEEKRAALKPKPRIKKTAPSKRPWGAPPLPPKVLTCMEPYVEHLSA